MERRHNKNLGGALIAVLVLALFVAGGCGIRDFFKKEKDPAADNTGAESAVVTEPATETEAIPVSEEAEPASNGYRIADNRLSDFDLCFLKLENDARNRVYSPLSIKLALSMLSEGAAGNTKAQIDSVLGGYQVKNYTNSRNLSLANGLFIRSEYRDFVHESYVSALREKYNAEVLFDTFATADPFNSWIEEKTLGQIPHLIDDATLAPASFVLGNALAIDMYWEDQLQYMQNGNDEIDAKWYYAVSFPHENYYDEGMLPNEFKTMTFGDQRDVTAAQIGASINNYNIIEIIGEDTIRNTVRAEFEKWLLTDDAKYMRGTDVDKYMDRYMEELKDNYGRVLVSTTISIYDGEEVKAFAKDLKEYDGTQLQYVAIMPKNSELPAYIRDVNADKINEVIGQLKELKRENFKEGVITRVTGFIPFFRYRDELALADDLNALGITDVFKRGKADLSKLTSQKNARIEYAAHSATIDFSNDGIKAAATSVFEGFGDGGDLFDYKWDVPVEVIDMTFDKPFIYVIRDKKTGEIWFTGAVYTVGESE